MRIGIACNYLKRGGGGMERQSLDLIEGLLDRGFRLTVFAKKFDPSLPLVRRLERVEQIGGWWTPNKVYDQYFSREVARRRKKLKLDTLIACNRTENAEIVLCGGNHIGYLRHMGMKAGFFNRWHIAMERRQFAGARRIVVCSLALKRELVELYGVAPDIVKVLYPAADDARFRPVDAEEREDLRRSFGFPADRRVFLFPSRNHEIKGLPFLRAFFERTDLPVMLAIVGAAATAGKNIQPLGYADNMERLYQAADATILASRLETFGMVAVESILCGTPVLFSEKAGCCEVLHEPAFYRIRPDDPALLERMVRKVLAFNRDADMDLRSCIGYDWSPRYFVDEIMKLL